MGKGKGMVERKTIRISKNTILFEFLGISPFKLFSFVKKINKKLNVKTRIVFNSSNKYKTSAKKGLNLLFYTKYLTTLSQKLKIFFYKLNKYYLSNIKHTYKKNKNSFFF